MGSGFVTKLIVSKGLITSKIVVDLLMKLSLNGLDQYFLGEDLPIPISLSPQGTDFQQRVWTYLAQIPYGESRTYGEIAQALSCRSAQAIGQAVGRNPLILLIPCHRVLGVENKLTGYAAGLDRKRWLLNHEAISWKE